MKASTAMAVVVLLAPALALAGVSKFKRADGVEAAALRGYTRVAIEHFGDGVEQQLKDAAQNAEYHAEVAEGGERFAKMLGARFEASGKFETVGVPPVAGRGLIVGGRITDYRSGNVATRYIGLGTRDRFAVVVVVRDAESGQELGTVEAVIKGSSIPGATNLLQTTRGMMDGAAVRASDEIMIALGLKRREETGRSGRLREKYD
jgi:hypothetical protein